MSLELANTRLLTLPCLQTLSTNINGLKAPQGVLNRSLNIIIYVIVFNFVSVKQQTSEVRLLLICLAVFRSAPLRLSSTVG